VRYVLEGLGARAAFALFRALPLDRASNFGGFLARTIGPHLGASKRARLNLQRAMPELSADESERIVRGMWDNLGRVVGEYPHLHEFDIAAAECRVEILGAEAIRAEAAAGKRFIFFSAHYGNWEIASVAAAQAQIAITGIYRAANNPLVDRLINRERSRRGGDLIPKGAVAARRAIAALRDGRHLSMLVDQKMNDGIAVPFFGRDAMTAPALARLALRFDCTVVPIRVERLHGAHFRLTCEPPLALPHSGNLQADTLALMTQVNAAVERWVRARPEQWFWLHRRWPD
jgi:Kdo2-lipid IVA lauroyltransferase/acyltransferase